MAHRIGTYAIPYNSAAAEVTIPKQVAVDGAEERSLCFPNENTTSCNDHTLTERACLGIIEGGARQGLAAQVQNVILLPRQGYKLHQVFDGSTGRDPARTEKKQTAINKEQNAA